MIESKRMEEPLSIFEKLNPLNWPGILFRAIFPGEKYIATEIPQNLNTVLSKNKATKPHIPRLEELQCQEDPHSLPPGVLHMLWTTHLNAQTDNKNSE